MVKYIKTQVKRYASWLENGGNYADYKCDFDSQDLNDAKICVTVFVDEYYYDKDPIFGGSSPTLWKRFVNKEERAMHILCNSNTSKDLESRATANSLYKKFETAPADQTWTSGAVSFEALNEEVNKYGSSVYAGYCPDGYRLPSQTELAVIRYYTGLVSTGYYPSRTFWSLGVVALGGRGKDKKYKYGFCINGGNIALSNSETTPNPTFSTARCVRDVRVE